MTEKEKSVPGVVLRRKGDPPITEPEIVDAEVVETENVEKEERQGSRRPETWETDFLQEFCVPPFPLSATKLAYLVRRIDWEGPQLMGAFYPALLRHECALLLQQTVYGFWDWRYPVTLETWARNIGFFRCAAIGRILWIYKMGEMEDVRCTQKR